MTDSPDQPSGADVPESPYLPDEVVAQDGVGVPDPFMRLWTPHRMAYIEGENKPTSDEAGSGCPFCRLPGLPDADALIVHRRTAAYAVLNLYPYNPGHLMVVPYRHVADYTELTEDELAERRRPHPAGDAWRSGRSRAPHGFNIGMNQGVIAGAGIAAHLHQHVVPRWSAGHELHAGHRPHEGAAAAARRTRGPCWPSPGRASRERRSPHP